jgi:hypothetical protein
MGWLNLPNDHSAENMINVHLMPGKIVVKQDGNYTTTSDLKLGEKSNITLIANRDSNGAATGSVYLDDGESKDQP